MILGAFKKLLKIPLLSLGAKVILAVSWPFLWHLLVLRAILVQQGVRCSLFSF